MSGDESRIEWEAVKRSLYNFNYLPKSWNLYFYFKNLSVRRVACIRPYIRSHVAVYPCFLLMINSFNISLSTLLPTNNFTLILIRKSPFLSLFFVSFQFRSYKGNEINIDFSHFPIWINIKPPIRRIVYCLLAPHFGYHKYNHLYWESFEI